MKPKMFSSNAVEHLFYHILDGFKTSHEGILRLKDDQLATDKEVNELIRKNCDRLIERIRDFRITEKILDHAPKRSHTWTIVNKTSERRRSRGPAKRQAINVMKR